MTVQPHPYLHSLHDVSFSYIFKSAYNMIIGCKLATTEYGAETFFQSQLVIIGAKPPYYEMARVFVVVVVVGWLVIPNYSL